MHDFIYNRNSELLHKDPPHERCNTDDIAREDRLHFTDAREKPEGKAPNARRNWRFCRWCWPTT